MPSGAEVTTTSGTRRSPLDELADVGEPAGVDGSQAITSTVARDTSASVISSSADAASATTERPNACRADAMRREANWSGAATATVARALEAARGYTSETSVEDPTRRKNVSLALVLSRHSPNGRGQT